MVQYKFVLSAVVVFYGFCITGTSPHQRSDVPYLDRYGSVLPPNLLSLARNLQHRMVDTHKATLARANKELIKLSSAPDLDTIKNNLAKYPLGLETFKKLLQLKNRKLFEMTSSLSRPVVHMYSTQNRLLRQLPEVMPEVIPEFPGLSSRDIDVYSEVLPSLLQVGGDMFTYHVNSVMSRPHILQNVAEKISAYVTGVEEDPGFEGPGSRHVLDLIREAGLEAEEHRVVTHDGYILALHRVTRPRHRERGPGHRQVVFLQHGLFCSSAVWAIGDRSKAFGFLLADAGFDVWMGNFRGNTYSRNHTHLNPEEDEFWQFSWDQMGQHDLPTMLGYVSHVTKTRDAREPGGGLVYIGHSMGTTAFWAMADIMPEVTQSLVSLMVGLAPISVCGQMSGPVRYLAPISGQIERMMSFTGNSEFGTRQNILQVFPSLCEPVPISVKDTEEVASLSQNSSLCSLTDNIFFTMSGFDAMQMNYTILPEILRQTPAGTSVKTVAQFAQGFNSKKFQHFDHGDPESNFEVYGSTEPPQYDLSRVSVPVLLFWGNDDWFSTKENVESLAAQLPRLIDTIEVPYDGWNHLDFMWAKDADTLLYKPIIDFIQNLILF